MSRTPAGIPLASIRAGMLPPRVRKISSSPTPSKGRKIMDILGYTHPKDRVNKRPKASECPFQCCGRGYTTQRTFRNHVRQMHESGAANVCRFCGRKSPNRRALDAHYQKVHFAVLLEMEGSKRREEEVRSAKKEEEERSARKEDNAKSKDTAKSRDSGYVSSEDGDDNN
ncbi:hypothetical protein CJF31_00002647 [Rutstroemia sp. NJR-2017a BVV2]|nr:hypothetical protein CJF31_00002647 [Rutstroemia sp. NJR-2017a BVV2]